MRQVTHTCTKQLDRLESVIFEWFMPHKSVSHATLLQKQWHKHSHTRTSQVTHMDESSHTYLHQAPSSSKVCHLWISHAACIKQSWHTHTWLTLHTCTNHGTYTYSHSCHTYLRQAIWSSRVWHLWASHVTHVSYARHTNAWLMSHTFTRMLYTHTIIYITRTCAKHLDRLE